MKFGQEITDEDIHTEPVDEDENEETPEHESVPTGYIEQECHVESISVDSEQPHNRLAEIQAAARLEKFPKKPDSGEPEPAKLETEDTVVTTEPLLSADSDFLDVSEDNYLDDYYDDF